MVTLRLMTYSSMPSCLGFFKCAEKRTKPDNMKNQGTQVKPHPKTYSPEVTPGFAWRCPTTMCVEARKRAKPKGNLLPAAWNFFAPSLATSATFATGSAFGMASSSGAAWSTATATAPASPLAGAPSFGDATATLAPFTGYAGVFSGRPVDSGGPVCPSRAGIFLSDGKARAEEQADSACAGGISMRIACSSCSCFCFSAGVFASAFSGACLLASTFREHASLTLKQPSNATAAVTKAAGKTHSRSCSHQTLIRFPRAL
mmetsp:Transcript_74567/g.188490  ORF Transcript_74567/g.188490 Transcript_74567/m.188490 type:complete len:259 (-) Transcript_74567:205-981(-)